MIYKFIRKPIPWKQNVETYLTGADPADPASAGPRPEQGGQVPHDGHLRRQPRVQGSGKNISRQKSQQVTFHRKKNTEIPLDNSSDNPLEK